MILEIYSKNFSLVHESEIVAEFLPRVGEIIFAEQLSENLSGMSYLLVHEVTHVYKEGKLTALVQCYASSSGEGSSQENRNIRLRENGWLNGGL